MAKQTLEQKMNEMTKEELRNFRDEKMSSLFTPNLSFPFQDLQRNSTIKVIIRAEEKLNGAKSATELKNKLYDMMRYQPLTDEQKEEKMADFESMHNAVEEGYLDGKKTLPKAEWQGKHSVNYRGNER